VKSDVTEFFNNSSSLTPESLLWLSVIVQAIHDARIDFNDVKIYERQLEDFELVCAMSGMDQSYVFRIYNKVMADDDIDPVAMLKQFMKY
jgi:hypothetical protein